MRSVPTIERTNSSLAHLSRDAQLELPAEHVILCLKCLVSASNGPVLEKAHIIIDTIIESLSTSVSSAPVQQAAFATVNVIISRIYTNDVSLTLRTVSGLLPIIQRLWSTKSRTVKDQMLVTLLLGEPYLPRMISGDAESRIIDLVNLVDVMRDEYCRRHNRDQMLVDELELVGITVDDQKVCPFRTRHLRLQYGVGRAESCWSLINVTASIIVALHRRPDAQDDNAEILYSEPAAKRRKTENYIDDVYQRLRLPELADKTYAVQVLCFLFDMVQFESATLQEYVEIILQCVSEENGSLCSWAMLAIAR